MQTPPPLTVSELCDRAQVWANAYYLVDGQPTRTANNTASALKALRAVAGTLPPASLRAETICDCQMWLVAHGVGRRTINDYIGRIKTVLRWAAKPPQRWIGPAVIVDVGLADSLKRHRTQAHETPGRHPVAWELVSSTIAAASMELATMIELHWWTGARPAEIVRIRRSEITEQDGMMIYAPARHKESHIGKRRIVVIGPNGQAVLRPWMVRVTADRIFHIQTANGYYLAVQRLNRREHLAPWCPGQIRHSYLTRVGTTDLDGARAAAGHSDADTTQLYIARDLKLAIAVQRVHG